MEETKKGLAGRTAIVTGSGQNLGRGIALAFAAAGANVVINGRRNRDIIEAVADEARALGVEAMTHLADVSDPAQVQEMVDATVARFGSADIAVSNAGIRPHQAFLDISLEDWDRVLHTNLFAAFYMARSILPHMMKTGWGRLIHISGQDGFIGKTNRAHNIVCKAGIHGLTKALALEFGPSGVTVNTVAPGVIQTTRDPKNYPDHEAKFEARRQVMPVRRLGEVEDIANACLYLVGESGRYVTGQAIHVNGGESMF